MVLMIHDTTGTQTDCEKPLSRKKLKQPQSRMALRSRMLAEKTGRAVGKKSLSAMKRKRMERKDRRKMFEKGTLSDGTTFQLIPTAADLEVMKPTLFERLGGLFGGFKKKFERMQAKGR